MLPVNRSQSPISTASANPVRVQTPRRHPSRRTTAVNSLVRGHRGDRRVEPVPARLDAEHRVVVGLEGQLRAPSVVEALPPQPRVVRRRSRPGRRSRRSPGAAAAWTTGAGPASDRRGSPPGPGPGPGPPPARRSGTATAVTSSSRSSRARCTASLASVLTRSPRAAATSTAPRPRTGSRPRSTPETARTRSARPHRPPRPDRADLAIQDRMCSCDGVNRACHSSPVTPSIAAAATDRACTSSPTLVRSVNTGASHNMSDRPSRQPLLGNPRICVSEAPARNPSHSSGHVHTV